MGPGIDTDVDEFVCLAYVGWTASMASVAAVVAVSAGATVVGVAIVLVCYGVE